MSKTIVTATCPANSLRHGDIVTLSGGFAAVVVPFAQPPLTDEERALYDNYVRAQGITGISSYATGFSGGDEASMSWDCQYCASVWSSYVNRCKSCGAPRR